jgi:hypothetical protein
VTAATTADLFAALWRPDERVAICHRAAGQFRAQLMPVTDALSVVAEHVDGDVWHSVNPVSESTTGRGGAADVTRLAALWADLDVKPGALPSLEAAEQVVADLATMLGTAPGFVVHTGHGLHPYWLLDDDERFAIRDDEHRADAVAVLARWRRLVTRVAVAHGGTVDAVFDLPRVLRTPGTVNTKSTPRVPTAVQDRGGYALDHAAVVDALTAYGVEEWPEDRQALGDVTAARADWPAVVRTCPYVQRMTAAWATDAPAAGAGRHHWAYSRLVRLACARRLGCITGHDFDSAARLLQSRLDELRAHDGRRPGEVIADLPYAIDVAERKTDSQARAELGNHDHPPTGDDLNGLIASPPAPPSTGEQPAGLDDPYQLLVADEVRKLRLRDDARAAYEREKQLRQPTPPFDAGLLADILRRPPEPSHRVEGLIPADCATLVVAQRKTGKTTWNLNLARALLTGEDFLGRFPVQPIAGRVGILNFEVSAAQLARWAADAGIDPDRLHLVNLRGRRNPLTHAADRAELAAMLRELDVEALFVDPFSRAYTGASQNDAGEVGAWLVDLDQFARTEVGARDLILNAHAGWDGERTRGASALEDWADSIVNLTKGKDDDAGRYMRAIGRDVDVDEDGLTYNAATRTLTMAGSGSRKAKTNRDRAAFLISAVHGVVNASPGMNGTQVEDTLRRQKVQFQKGQERSALAAAVEQGLLRMEQRGSAKLYYPAQPPQTSPDFPRGSLGNLPTSPLYGEGEVPGEKGTRPPRGHQGELLTEGDAA